MWAFISHLEQLLRDVVGPHLFFKKKNPKQGVPTNIVKSGSSINLVKPKDQGSRVQSESSRDWTELKIKYNKYSTITNNNKIWYKI